MKNKQKKETKWHSSVITGLCIARSYIQQQDVKIATHFNITAGPEQISKHPHKT